MPGIAPPPPLWTEHQMARQPTSWLILKLASDGMRPEDRVTVAREIDRRLPRRAFGETAE